LATTVIGQNIGDVAREGEPSLRRCPTDRFSALRERSWLQERKPPDKEPLERRHTRFVAVG
jgi:hypothetical protein